MAGMEWIVLIGGLGAIALVNWWFFFAERTAGTAAASASGVQEIEVVVLGGYQPAVVKAKAGKPLRLVFDRRETNSCSEEIVIPDFGVRRFLPANARTAVEVMPEKPGTYEFTCGMSMLRGKIEVE